MATRLSSRDGRDGIIAVKQRELNGTATVSSPRHHVAGHGIAVATRVGGHTRGGRSHPAKGLRVAGESGFGTCDAFAKELWRRKARHLHLPRRSRVYWNWHKRAHLGSQSHTFSADVKHPTDHGGARRRVI